MNIFGKEISDVVVRKIYACSAGFDLPCFKRTVETEFSQETAASYSDDASSLYGVIVIQILVSPFVYVHMAFLYSSPIQSEYPLSWHYLWHFKSRTREQPEQERPRAV